MVSLKVMVLHCVIVLWYNGWTSARAVFFPVHIKGIKGDNHANIWITHILNWVVSVFALWIFRGIPFQTLIVYTPPTASQPRTFQRWFKCDLFPCSSNVPLFIPYSCVLCKPKRSRIYYFLKFVIIPMDMYASRIVGMVVPSHYHRKPFDGCLSNEGDACVRVCVCMCSGCPSHCTTKENVWSKIDGTLSHFNHNPFNILKIDQYLWWSNTCWLSRTHIIWNNYFCLLPENFMQTYTHTTHRFSENKIQSTQHQWDYLHTHSFTLTEYQVRDGCGDTQKNRKFPQNS